MAGVDGRGGRAARRRDERHLHVPGPDDIAGTEHPASRHFVRADAAGEHDGPHADLAAETLGLAAMSQRFSGCSGLLLARVGAFWQRVGRDAACVLASEPGHVLVVEPVSMLIASS